MEKWSCGFSECCGRRFEQGEVQGRVGGVIKNIDTVFVNCRCALWCSCWFR